MSVRSWSYGERFAYVTVAFCADGCSIGAPTAVDSPLATLLLWANGKILAR